MELSFIIVNYNLASEVCACIESLLTNVSDIEYEIIVVDNNSSDVTSKTMEQNFPRTKFPNIHFFFLSQNKGFGSSCNFGVARSSAEIVCFLNPDILIKDNVFPELLKLLKSNKDIAAVGPRSTVKKCFDFSAGVFPNIYFEFLNIFYVGRHFESIYIFLKSKLLKGKPFLVDWILGASIIIKKDIFNKVNGFDEDYFLYFEEMDLFYRLRKMGYKIYYYPAQEIEHLGSMSTKKNYSFFTRTFYNSKLLFFEKQYGILVGKIFKFVTYLQVIFQLFLWIIMIPFSKNKSVSKLRGFWRVLRNGLKDQNSTFLPDRF